MKKTGFTFVLYLVFVFLLVAPVAAQDATTIDFWIPAGRGRDESMAAVVEAFEALHPEINVEITSIPFNEFLNATQVAYAGNNPPDVALTNGVAIQNLAYNGALLPIEDAFTEDDLADFMPDLVDMVSLDGHMYGAPWAQAGNVMYYNVPYFEAAGIEVPQTMEEAWTWPEFVENVNQVRAAQAEAGNDIYGMVGLNNPMTGAYFTWTIIRSASAPGEPLWDSIASDWTTVDGYINTPEAMEAYAFYQSLYTEGFMPSAEVPDAFGTGQAATYFGIPPTGTEISLAFPELEWATMPIPYLKTPLVHTGSFAPTVSAKSDNPDEAKLLAAFIASGEGYLISHAVTPQLPGRISVRSEIPELQDGYLARVFDEVLAYGVARPGGPAHAIFDSLIAQEMMVNIALGGNIEEEVAAAVQKTDAQLMQFR
ncbi:MAG: sugar ABC transporter substrate-binding protein [Anaerolineae bacterium]|nr:sugar ABC transporter substrate-binding protein [Anaerolineae bacterium]